MAESQGNTTPTRPERSSGPGGRGPLPRRSTRGPLDISQAPVSEPVSPSGSQLLSPRESATSSFRRAASPQPSPTAPNTAAIGQEHAPRDFARLLRPEIYHPLTQLETPPSFRSSSKQPSPETPIDVLLKTGHFRAAAISAANKLTLSVQPNDPATIFDLLYVRLVCLTLCGNTALAAQEVKALEDLNSSTYRDDLSRKHFVPWELRVLAVRLQGMGFSDSRKGVVGYYDLAREARQEISTLKAGFGDAGDRERKIWEARLEDLGIRVASALVEMEDFSAAASHLATLKGSDNGQLAVTKALLWLRIGDPAAARKAVEGSLSDSGVINALCRMADGEYDDAVQEWTKLCEADKSNEMYSQNLAVCLLYSGRMAEGRDVLEKLVHDGKSFHGLTFNLSTMYELCTDRSRALKVRLAEQVASLPDTDGSGWEKANPDFKL